MTDADFSSRYTARDYTAQIDAARLRAAQLRRQAIIDFWDAARQTLHRLAAARRRRAGRGDNGRAPMAARTRAAAGACS